MTTSPGSDPQYEDNTQLMPASESEYVEEADSATPEEQTEYIQLRADQLNNEIARLERENADFARLFNTRIGDKAAKQYKPQIQAREEEIERLRMELRRRDILAMDEEEIENKFSSDPNFAREYAELVHYQPQPEQGQDESHVISAAVNDAFDQARSFGVNEETIRKVQIKAARGDYDRDDEHWVYSLQRMQAELTANAVTSAKPPRSKTNPELSKGGPDLTPANRNAGSVSREIPDSVAAFRALPVERQKEILADPEGLAAVEELVRKG